MLQFNNAKNECINVNTKEEIILKKLVSLLEAILLMVMAFPLTALAGQEGTQIISPVFCIPFAGLLLCVAIMPLVKAEWWESHPQFFTHCFTQGIGFATSKIRQQT